MTTQEVDSINGKAVYKRLLSYVKPYWVAFVFALIGMLFVAATETGFAAIMKPLLDGSFVAKDPTLIALVPVGIIVIFLLRGVGSFAVSFCMAWVGRHVIKDLRRQMFDHYLTLPTRFYDQNPSGRLLSKLVYDVEQVAEASSQTITVFIQDVLTLIGLISWMLYLNWQLAILFLTMGPLTSFLVVIVNKRMRRISQRLQTSVGDVTHIAQEAIDANRVVKLFGGQVHESGVFNRANEDNRQQYMKIVATNAASTPIVQLLAACLLALIVYLATRPEMLATISVGTFMSFISAALLLFPPLKRLITINASVQRGITAAQSVFGFLDEEKERDTGTTTLPRARGEIEFQNVGFTYDERKGPALHDINLSVRAGESVALVGRSGSGKSTLVGLIPRFYNPSSGRILLDGIDTQALTLNDLRKHIALVSQDITLFNDTIAHNIAYGSLETADEKTIIRAAEAAYAMEFINQLPDGLNTRIGARGVMLSGGQRQRLAIARAILKNSPILILDEATSALDSESERAIQAALEGLMKNRTTFVIAHRLSTIERVDRILVMQQGRIIEQGTHAELLARDQQYALLHRMQFHES